MGMGKEISFDEFLAEIDLTLDDYIWAIRSSLNNTAISLKRDPNAIRVNAYNPILLNTLRPRQKGRHFADDIFKCIFVNENA